jgi:hypothetical protein
MAVARLSGEILDGVSIDGRTGATIFYFDLGAQIIVRGRSGASDDSELWSLSNQSRVVTIYRGGRYSSGSVKKSNENELPIGAQVVAARNPKMRRAILGTLQQAAV